MTADVEAAPACAPPAAPPDPLASWRARAGALGVDVLPGAGVLVTALLVAWTVPQYGLWWWLSTSAGGAATLALAANRVLLPAVTGWSLGRAVFGLTVVATDGTHAGPARLLLRDLAHLLDTATLLLGWVWPLWDRRRRTFADLLVGTEVWRGEPRREAGSPLRWTAVLALSAALVCVTGGAVSYLVAYQHDRAADQVRAQLAQQGPKIVSDMLTFDPKTLADDFARAQSLATDNYREQLTTVQQQVRNAATPHAYWSPNSAVLSATKDRATMLMFLQGSAGEQAQVQPVTATVRVRFAKVRDRWLVDDLTFVPQPAHAGAGP